MDRITVIIPVYNTAAYLEKCVLSVMNQTLPPYEVILVDDGSTDESPVLCDRFAQLYPTQIHVIHQKNQGLSSARNTGMDAARGDVLSFVDSDDYLSPEMYGTLLPLMQRYQAQIVAGEAFVEKTTGEKYCRGMDNPECLVWNTKQALTELCSYRYLYFGVWAYLFRRGVFDGLRFPVGKTCEDQLLLYKVFARAHTVVYSSRPLYHYVQRPQSISRSASVNLTPIEASQAQLQFFKQHFPDLVSAAQTDYAIVNMSVYTNAVRNGAVCPKEVQKSLVKACRRYLPVVLKNQHIPRIKKVQLFVFCCSRRAYRVIVSKKEHR